MEVSYGAARPSLAIPLDSADISGGKAAVFVLRDGVARKMTFRVQGERGGLLFVEPPLSGQPVVVVTEGRATLNDGDRVAAKDASPSVEKLASQEPG